MQDLTDELLSSLIRDERYWRTSCHVRPLATTAPD